jgi:pentose-5-phosphate-3-epimerase
MMQITPAVLAPSFERVVSELFVLEGLSNRVQIDLVDGVFGLEKTWLPYEEKELPSGFSYEFDLMVVDWEKYLLRVIALGSRRVVMHIDRMTPQDIEDMLTIVMKHTLHLGLAVSNTYDVVAFVKVVNTIADRYPKVFVQVMGIRTIGVQGQPFDPITPSRIAYISHNCSHIEIQVDGSMNPETMVLVRNAGARCAVVGSYLSKSGNVKKALDTLQKDFM